MILGTIATLVLSVFLAPSALLAQTPTDTFGVGEVKTGLDGTLGEKDLIPTITSIINVALGLLGIIAVVIILAGGFQWMTAGGNEEAVEGAKKRIIQGVVGLAIIMSAFAIASFVFKSLQTATGSGDFEG